VPFASMISRSTASMISSPERDSMDHGRSSTAVAYSLRVGDARGNSTALSVPSCSSYDARWSTSVNTEPTHASTAPGSCLQQQEDGAGESELACRRHHGTEATRRHRGPSRPGSDSAKVLWDRASRVGIEPSGLKGQLERLRPPAQIAPTTENCWPNVRELEPGRPLAQTARWPPKGCLWGGC
jgi:hypothetical protein